jgi:hypothetical protein
VENNRNLILVYYFALVAVAAGVAGTTVADVVAEASVLASTASVVAGATCGAVSVVGAADSTVGAAGVASAGFCSGEQATRAARISVSILISFIIKFIQLLVLNLRCYLFRLNHPYQRCIQ